MHKLITLLKGFLTLTLSLGAIIIAALSIYVSAEEIISLFTDEFTFNLLMKSLALLVFHIFVFICVLVLIATIITRPIRKPLVGKSRLPFNRR